MQKHAYQTQFAPLPSTSEQEVHYDERAVELPFWEEVPLLHYHDRYELGVCEEGEGLFLAEDSYWALGKGDCIFLSPGMRHYSRSLDAEHPCRCRFFYLHPSVVMPLLGKEYPKGRIPPVLYRGERKKAVERIHEMLDDCRYGHLTALRLAAFLLAEGNEEDGAAPPVAAAESPAALAAEYLALHYQEPYSAKALAGLCHLSESQMRRVFRATYGMSPLAYRNQLRLQIGAELLRRGSLSVGEIALRLGYSAPADFYRAFLKTYRCAPSRYRAEQPD